MSLHTHKTFRRPGLPDMLLVVLLVAAAALATTWWRYALRGSWETTTGTVADVAIRDTHANAQDYPTKVILDYEYYVDGQRYTKHWEGLWPETNSPNALLRTELHRLKNPDHLLQILYDPKRPDNSSLHVTDAQEEQRLYGWLLGGTFCIMAFYCVRVYPAWKGRSA